MQQQFRGDQFLTFPQESHLRPRVVEICPGGPVSLVGGPGLSQRPVIWHGSEERVPELAVDEKHNEQHQQEEQ